MGNLTATPPKVVKRNEWSKSKLLTQFDLTPRQVDFIYEYVTNGTNGTQAALAVYDARNKKVAAVCASQLLSNPKVSKAISELLGQKFINKDWAVGKLVSYADKAPSYDSKIRSVAEIGKILGLYAKHEGKAATGINVNIGINLPMMGSGKIVDVEFKEK